MMPGSQGGIARARTITRRIARTIAVAEIGHRDSLSPCAQELDAELTPRRRRPRELVDSQQQQQHSAAAFRRARRRLAAQEGFTLIEAMIVLSIFAVILVGFAGLVAAFYNTPASTQQMSSQQQTLESVGGYMQSKILAAQRPFGLLDEINPARIDPLTITGDQLVFKSGSLCYRVFYLQSARQIRVSVGDSCASIRPKRGPNDGLTDVAGLGSPGQNNMNGTWEPGESHYDPSLDAPAADPGSTTRPAWSALARNVVPSPPANAPTGSPSPLETFAYRGDDATLYTVDARADADPAATHADFYSAAANREGVATIDLILYLAGASDDPLVSDRYHRRNLSSAPTQAAFGPPVSARLDGNSNSNWQSVAAGERVQVQGCNNCTSFPGGTKYLRSAEIGSQSAWLELDGQVTFRSGSSSSSTGGTPIVEAVLYRDPDGPSGPSAPTDSFTASSELRTKFVFQGTRMTGDTPRTVAYSGSFRLPTGTTDNASTTYSVRMFAVNADTANMQYSNDRTGMYLRYRVVPR